MNRLQMLTRGIGQKYLGNFDRVLTQILASTGKESSVLENPYSMVDLVYACITRTASAIAQVPLMVMKKNKKTGKFDPVDEDDPWQSLIDQPNYMTSKMLFITSIVSYVLLDGCMAIIPFPPSSKTIPASLWNVRWRFMGYDLDDNGHLERWKYTPRLSSQEKVHHFKPHEVFQVKFWNPDNPLEGFAPVQAGRLPILELYKSTEYNHKFFDNSAVPGGVLTTPQKLHKDVLAQTDKKWREVHRGYEKSHEIAILQQDLKFQPTGMSQKDMDFVQLRSSSQEAIMQIFGMKKVILGKTESLNYATAKEQRKEWWNGTCLPLMRMISDALSFGLFLNPISIQKYRDHRVMFDISSIEALHEDYSSKVKTGEALFRMGVPFEEINAMLELGFDPKDWYSLAYVPVQMMCVNFKDVGRENPIRPGDTAGNSEPSDGNKPEPDKPEEDEDKTAKGSDKIEHSPIERSVAVITDYVERVWEEQIERISGSVEQANKEPVKQLVNRIRRGIFDCRSTVLKALLTDNKDPDLKAVDKDLFFNNVMDKTLAGIDEPWNNLFVSIQKTLLVNEKTVDIKKDRAIREAWFSTFLSELGKYFGSKRKEVSGILSRHRSSEDAAYDVRKLFNDSLNDAMPIVKAEVRRLIVLALKLPTLT